ncbi:MAG TPA: CAP domain-containing protein, partial [Isosphaeraceae bacterium]|nr:CAP domain-containing protein [Isosphaeraceae bacterium]
MNASRVEICVVTIALLTSCGRADEPVDSVLDALVAAHNHERELAHVAPLKLSRTLCQSAADHASDMAKQHKLDHKGSDGSTVADRAKRKGYAFVRVGENIAQGQKSVEKVMDIWMKSPGHRANILADYTEMGAAQAEDDNGDPYWCVNFGIPIPRLNPDEA